MFVLVLTVMFNNGDQPKTAEIQVGSLQECWARAEASMRNPPTGSNIELVGAGCVIKYMGKSSKK